MTSLRIHNWILSQSQTQEWYNNPGYEVFKKKKKKISPPLSLSL